MEALTGVLVRRLAGKGMEVSAIPAYVRDLANTMVAHGYSGLQELNRRLQSLGWDGFELDDCTLQLIIAIFEPDLVYKPPHWFDRTFNPPRLSKLTDEGDCVPALHIDHNKPLQE